MLSEWTQLKALVSKYEEMGAIPTHVEEYPALEVTSYCYLVQLLAAESST